MADVVQLKEERGHSTMAVTHDGSPNGRLLGIVTSRDYRVSRMAMDTPVHQFMTPMEKIVFAREGITPVSYTHLDVYKRQIECCDKFGMVMAFTGLRLFHH